MIKIFSPFPFFPGLYTTFLMCNIWDPAASVLHLLGINSYCILFGKRKKLFLMLLCQTWLSVFTFLFPFWLFFLFRPRVNWLYFNPWSDLSMFTGNSGCLHLFALQMPLWDWQWAISNTVLIRRIPLNNRNYTAIPRNIKWYWDVNWTLLARKALWQLQEQNILTRALTRRKCQRSILLDQDCSLPPSESWRFHNWRLPFMPFAF